MEERIDKKRRFFSIRTKMYIFVIVIVLIAAFGASAIAFTTEADQIDRYYKQNTEDNASNFASMVDGDFLSKLRDVAKSEEFQKLRKKAEKEENEKLIENYLRKKGLWNQYKETRDMITDYLKNMKGIKYLYIIAHGDKDAKQDMYLIDDADNPIYETGYYEEREPELRGMDLTKMPEPKISNGDWGWLCSDFKPVYDSKGKDVCIVGCDIGMDDVMKERQRLLILLVAGTLALIIIVLVAAVLFMNRTVVKPLNRMTGEMKNFTPSEGLNYEDAGVIDLNIKSNDEIGEIYHGIRNMQMNIIDYLKDMLVLQEDKERAEIDLKDKDEQIDQLNIETYKDALTSVGNKAAYIKRVKEMNQQMEESEHDYAVVVVDINNLKQINDEHGHKSGDVFIKGCCHMVCEVFKHSPVFRIGGDEFAVLLSDADYNNRKELVNLLKSKYEEAYEQKDVPPWEQYTAAVGMAEIAADDNTLEFAFKRADKEMYKDKARFKEKYGIKSR